MVNKDQNISGSSADKALGHLKELSRREADASHVLLVRAYTCLYQFLPTELLIYLQLMNSTPMIEQSLQYQDRLKRGNDVEGFVSRRFAADAFLDQRIWFDLLHPREVEDEVRDSL